ncbi:MAG: hypothetical protein DWQ19_09415 [Crenarchaeota archaeon]|nr:MAG: hypothetical protein DWQ19_09415 [Thermoproteota archaeon]
MPQYQPPTNFPILSWYYKKDRLSFFVSKYSYENQMGDTAEVTELPFPEEWYLTLSKRQLVNLLKKLQ